MVYRILRGSAAFCATPLAVLAAILAVSAGCEKDGLDGPAAEVAEETGIKLDLPAIPEFTPPTTNPDGSHSVKEMRLRSQKMLNTDVTVRGVVVWVYDCAETLRSPSLEGKALAKKLSEHPELCTRPHFYLADEAGTAPNGGIMVAEYPRPLRPDEKKSKDPAEVASITAALKELPDFKVGDEVLVTGQWKNESPGGFIDSYGLLVYGSMKKISGE